MAAYPSGRDDADAIHARVGVQAAEVFRTRCSWSLTAMDIIKRYVALGMGISVGPRLAIEQEDERTLGTSSPISRTCSPSSRRAS